MTKIQQAIEALDECAKYLEQTTTCNADRAVAATMRKALAALRSIRPATDEEIFRLCNFSATPIPERHGVIFGFRAAERRIFGNSQSESGEE